MSTPSGQGPQLAIITPTRNRLAGLVRAVESVRRAGVAVEHVVVDGGSTDGTAEWLATESALRVIHDPTPGMYAALNTGLEATSARWVMFLNSDDVLEPGALERIFSALEERIEDEGLTSFCGEAVLVEAGTDVGLDALWQAGPIVRYDTADVINLSGWALAFGPTILNARVLQRRLLLELGGFDVRSRISADRELLIRARLHGMRVRPLGAPVYRYTRHPGSMTLASGVRFREENRAEQLATAARLVRETQRETKGDDGNDIVTWLRRWHAVESAVATVMHLRRGRLAAAFGVAAQGLRTDPLLPGWLLRESIRRLFLESPGEKRFR